MTNEPNRTETLEALLIALTEELEAATDLVAGHDALTRFREMLDHCVNAAAFAKSGQRLADRYIQT